MTGTSFPPGLRFPTGAMLGTHFIVAGTYLTQSYQSFSIWALDLVTMTWSRIDPGSALGSGSWFRSCLWPEANKLIIFGNASGNLAADYNRRLLSWDHVACIDLEAFGIYQYPKLYMPIEEQQLGLAALEEGFMTDFDILCDDGRKIAVSRKILEERWPWFKQQRNLFLQNAARAVNTLQPAAGAGTDVPLPELASLSKEPRADPRLSSRLLNLSESYPISLALVQYFYTKALITPLQHAPAVLSQLLLLSSTYNLGHLQSLVKHAMHRALTYATSVGIYGVSTLCNCRSLQIRYGFSAAYHFLKLTSSLCCQCLTCCDGKCDHAGSQSHHFLTTKTRHTVRNDPRGEPGTERTGAVEMELVGEGWILQLRDPEGCLMLHSCKGLRQILLVTALC